MTGRGGAGVRVATAVVAAGLVACSGGSDDGRPGAAAPASDRPAAGAEGWTARTDDDAVFTVDCPFSHRAADDPIVHPGRPGASHSHEFFGSEATDAGSTGEALRGTPTTCEDQEDTAAYWVPTLSVDGEPVEPSLLRAYYRAPVGADVREVVAPPLGLAMIAGDPAAGGHDHAGPADEAHPEPGEVGWGCGLRPRRLHAAPPLDCTARSPVTLQLRFPDCWDGRRLDSAGHRSHVARSEAGECPATHPVLMTELQLSVSWPVTGPAAAGVVLASGSVQGAHGDFLNGWELDALDRHVELCIHAKANCTIG